MNGSPQKSAVLKLGLLLLALGSSPTPLAQPSPREGVAMAIVYDTSGSMLQKVRDSQGGTTPKQVIARRALRAVIDRLDALTSAKQPNPLTLHAGLVTFRGDRAQAAIPFGPFAARSFRTWLGQEDKILAGTPLGDAVRVAGQMVLDSPLPRKHVLVITDGINTKGPDPAAILPKLQEAAAAKDTRLAIHFVAFDLNAAVFTSVRNLGATVVSAADEVELSAQLEFIMQKKILLEEEELPVAKPKTH